ncbi:MAG TPA: hypothetical protein VJX66_29130 [Amycolatopsis sp.]|nr:hypothetical protein [Amycolatopsis sp.]
MRSRRARRITVVFAAALLGTAALAPSAGASAFPGTNGPIVFAHSPGNGQSIWITNPDGSGTHALTSPPSGFFDASPRFSADGAWITFERGGFPSASNFGQADHVMVMRANGSCITDLSQGIGGTVFTDGHPSFAADGSYVVFQRLNEDTDQSVGIFKEGVALNCSGGSVTHGTPQQLTTGNDSDPTISADGTRIAFARESASNIAIYVAPLSNPGAAQDVSHPGPDDFDFLPDFSPNGTKVAFTRNGDIDVTNSDGSGSVTTLVPHATSGVGINQAPAFSPDGSRIVFQRATGAGPGGSPGYGLYTVSSSGGTPTAIPGLGSSSTASNQSPDWAPRSSSPPPPSSGCGSGSSHEPDANGDLHSHCHTGAKGRGAGGNDKRR